MDEETRNELKESIQEEIIYSERSSYSADTLKGSLHTRLGNGQPGKRRHQPPNPQISSRSTQSQAQRQLLGV
jgi:hypothetical protein